MKFSAQKPEVKLPSNAVDLDVMRMMRKLEDHDKSLIFDVFGVKSLTIPTGSVLFPVENFILHFLLLKFLK